MESAIAQGNRYDNVILDVNALFRDFETLIHKQTRLRGKRMRRHSWRGILRRYLTGLTYALRIHDRLLYANILLEWFFEFEDYWVHFLGNRPISVQDFHFLRNEYRKRFQDVTLMGDAAGEYLQSWQDPRNIYSIFGSVWNSAFRDLISFKFAKYVKRNALVCEYGCGIAPITHSFLKYYPEKKLRPTIADIPQFTFHFAKWRFREEERVNPVTIDILDDNPLPEDELYGAIFICQVFEHLQDPLRTARYLHDKLEPEGVLVFDYVKSEGTGLDTKEGVALRDKTLEYIMTHFHALKGGIDPQRGVGTVIVRRRK